MSLITSSLFSISNAHAADNEPVLWTARWNHDGSQFAVGGVGKLWLFDSNTFEMESLLPRLSHGHSENTDNHYVTVTRVAWHPDSNLLAVSSQGGNVNGIYDVASGDRIALTTPAEDSGRGVSWSPDGDRVAFTIDDRLMISKADGTLLHDIPRYRDAKGLTGAAWSPAGDRIVTIGGRITLHDAQGRPIKQTMHRPEAVDDDQLLLGVAWHPGGDSILTSSIDGRDFVECDCAAQGGD